MQPLPCFHKTCATLSVVVSLLATACGSTNDIVTDASVAADTGAVADTGASSDAGSDTLQDTGVLADGGGSTACERCAMRRCTPIAASCAADPDCIALANCRGECSSITCLDACGAGQSESELFRADALNRCRQNCPIACSVVPVRPRPEMCQPRFANCDAEVPGFGCCDNGTTCVEPVGECCADGYCCAGVDQTCNADHPCCRGSCGTDGRCEIPTCNVVDCAAAPERSCCDARQTCGNAGVCCFRDGTELADTQLAARCCSSAVETLPNSQFRCVPIP